MKTRLYSAALLVCGLATANLALAQVPDCGDNDAALAYWRPIAAQNTPANVDSLAVALLQCLSSPNAELRDEIAYGLMTTWLRSKSLSPERQLFLVQQLSTNLASRGTETSLQRSFSALILSELLRADALKAFMTDAQRDVLLHTSSAALSEEDDYRGWDETLGWVHPIAHMADVMWRFALHPALNETQAQEILQAVGNKAAVSEAFYHFNEGDRLARPITILLRREAASPEEFTEWLAQFETPKSTSSWGEAFGSREGLAELHNSKLFIRALADQLQGVDLPGVVQEKLAAVVALLTNLV